MKSEHNYHRHKVPNNNEYWWRGLWMSTEIKAHDFDFSHTHHSLKDSKKTLNSEKLKYIYGLGLTPREVKRRERCDWTTSVNVRVRYD